MIQDTDGLHKALEASILRNEEVYILREIQHTNVVRFIGACTKTTAILHSYSLQGFLVVKVADFGVARFQDQGGIMTAETGTYRWMAPEIPYDTMTPLQAAVGVRQVGITPRAPKKGTSKAVGLIAEMLGSRSI
ncbi:hypothetical protein HU200_011623 [Digitaria exilis]|uniref:Protein kinase domain-containing protein n=1 Tax=Digitaria exilis TaxID=1010633 RepID=A0A835FGU9_9POAL|nr:hypothetical protein HU200_011623 [Digitaria exilis]